MVKKKEPEITLVEYFDEHWYKINHDGVVDYFPSVTTKLGIVSKPFLARWRGDIGNREADMRLWEAQERGTRIHHGWYTITQGGIALYNPWQKPNYTDEEIAEHLKTYDGKVAIIRHQDEMIQLWRLKQFMDAVNPEIVASELEVFSLKYREAGTVDNVFRIKEGSYLVNGSKPLELKGGLYVGDLKTGNSFDDNAYMQMASYANMYGEMYGRDVVGILGIHTNGKNRTGVEGLNVNYHGPEEMEEDFRDYRNVSAVWERKNKTAQPKTFEFPALIKI